MKIGLHNDRSRSVYISGRITGNPDGYISAFNNASLTVRTLGYIPVNPVELDHSHDRTWTSYMAVDIAHMMHCRTLVLLPGWWRSRGAKVEALTFGLVFGFRNVFTLAGFVNAKGAK